METTGYYGHFSGKFPRRKNIFEFWVLRIKNLFKENDRVPAYFCIFPAELS
jgi:hypothetical protein